MEKNKSITRDEYKKRVNFFKAELGIKYKTKELYSIESLNNALKEIALKYSNSIITKILSENSRLKAENEILREHLGKIEISLKNNKKKWWKIF